MKVIKINTILLIIAIIAHPGISQEVEIGEAYVVGATWLDLQHNSTIGKMISRDDQGGAYFAWVLVRNNNGHEVWINQCNDHEGDLRTQLNENGGRWDSGNGAGFVSIDLIRAFDTVLPVGFYFGECPLMQVGGGIGFPPLEIRFPLPDTIETSLWSKGTIDRLQRAHVVAATLSDDGLFFNNLLLWKAEAEDDFLEEWVVGDPVVVDQTTILGHCIKASRHSDRVALAWHHNIAGCPYPEEWERVIGAWQRHNDIFIVESENGDEWNLDEPFNITRTVPPDPDLDPPYNYGDTLRAWSDIDLIYSDDILHAVFSSCGFWMNLNDEHRSPMERISARESFIWHWDSESDTLTLVAGGWYEHEGYPSVGHCNVSRPSLGLDDDGTMYCVFRQVTGDDIAENGYCNAEIMLSMSTDNGITWSEAVNLTGTESPGAGAGECLNENYPSLAERVDDNLHLFYLLDSDAGSSLYDEGRVTESLMIYQRVLLDELPDVGNLELPREGFQYHNRPGNVSVREKADLTVKQFSIDEIYPNPFNSRTRITYSLSKSSSIHLTIYNLQGRLIAGLVDEKLTAGNHIVSWDAAAAASGLYLVRMEIAGSCIVRKAILMK